MRGSWSAATLALAVLGLPAGLIAPAAASAPPETPAGPAFGERIDVRAVDVEAAVTDRSGHRVRGLTAADFRLLVDGKEVPIDSFTAVEDGRNPAPAASTTGVAGTEPATAASTVSRNFLVFLDNAFAIAAQRDRVLDTLAGQLSLLAPDDRMAVVAFDGEHLATLADWTANRATLAAALASAKGQPADGNRVVAARRSSAEDRKLQEEYDPILEAKRIFGRLGPLTLESPVLQNAAQVRALVRGMPRVVAATDAALRTLVPPPGRRVLLLLSGGWPFSSYPALFWPLTATANQLGYTFYPVDVPGLDSEAPGADARQESPGPQAGFITSEWERDSQYTLELLARATGGKAIVHSARLTALARAADDTRSYYRLGFSPNWRADDRQHPIRVEVRRPGLAVRARESYTDLSPTAEGALEKQRREIAGSAPDAPDAAGGVNAPLPGPTALER
jgi:VWFA-related protein